MSITSPQELAQIIPEWSIFTAGYLLKDAEHQKKVFEAPFMEPMKKKVEDKLGVKLLTVMYLGRRQLNLRFSKAQKDVQTPDDLKGVKLRMPGTDAWQFLGRALGANPVPVAFTEVYTALQTGAIDGQDNPLPTDKDFKFYEVTKQICLTSHLVDQNYIAFSKKVWDKMSQDEQATRAEGAERCRRQRARGAAEARRRPGRLLQEAGARRLHPERRCLPQACPGSLPELRLLEGLAEGHGRQDQRALRLGVAGR